ncbi:DUF1836 domain-containing protein [Neobacillus sp. LXY-1]|uniref:DUF1836 domain-containing protein n=1 Tax=Neobacillus sp. LXY-1 TaxID=3379133 RepID=UPI003EE033E6
MEDIKRILNELDLEANLTLEDMPNIDLYMDQIIQLFENKFSGSKRNEDEKVFTKTMINNYAKGKLLFPIKNKKYSKEHLILISLIYQLKGALSINDIKTTLDGINKWVIHDELELDPFYNSYLNLTQKNVKKFNEDLPQRVQEVEAEISTGIEGKSPYLEQVLMISSLVHMSNLYRKVAEKLVDSIVIEKETKRQK